MDADETRAEAGDSIMCQIRPRELSLHLSRSWCAFNAAVVSVTMMVAVPKSAAEEGIPPYCSELKRVSDLAATNERFASISLKPREGDFIESSVVLAGWSDCTVYGARTYTCDSRPFETAEDAGQAQVRIGSEVLTCLGQTWVEAKNRSSPGFMVLQHAERPISVTLSLDQTEHKQHVVRLILFGRSN
jgi:hypothetical protein